MIAPLSCLIVITLLTEVLTQRCYRECNCLKKDLTKCTSNITHLDIDLRAEEIIISCKQSISIDYYNDVPSFDAKYLTIIDDKSPLTLASMANKCYHTQMKNIRYALDSGKLSNISITKALFSDKNSISNFKFQGDNAIIFLQPDFLAHGSHLKTLVVNKMRISNLKNYFQNSSHIETLDLASNQIETIEKTVFKNLTHLKHLNLRDNNITVLHQEIFPNIISIDLSVNYITSLPVGTFSNLGTLRFLNLSENNLKIISNDSFKVLTRLEDLDLSGNSHLKLQENAFANLTSLKSLNLSRCHLENIPTNLLYNSQQLILLNISRNVITELGNDPFRNLSELRIVDLSYNSLESLPITLLEHLEKLQEIYLSSNRLTEFNSEVFWKVHTLELIDMSDNLISQFSNRLGRFRANKVILRNNSIETFPAFFIYITGIGYLDISYNSISYVELMKDLVPKTSHIVVDASYNQINQLNVTHLDHHVAKKKNGNWQIMLDLSTNELKCNCLSYQIDRVPQSQSRTMVVQLTSKEIICYYEVPHYNCPLISIKNCPQQCHCYYTRIDNAIVVDCSYRNLTKFLEISGLKTDRYQHEQTFVYLNGNQLDTYGQEVLKDYSNVTRLDLSDNSIKQLKWLPINVKELNLNDNRLTTLPENIVETLASNVDKVTFENNPWECDCKALHLQKYLIQYNNIKVNQSAIICHDTGEALVYTKICENSHTLKVALALGLTAILALVSATLALYFKYNTSIKVYLYSKNLCLWCVAEEEVDKDKTYDVFISYSHKDEDFVQKELLPELESGDAPLTICIHYRDWLPGEFISTQIVSSVLSSRRTLVILSNDFMESVWGKMEFRTAHLQAINEGRARVIMVLYGELDESILDDEMKTYLKTNTYVKWGDPWFWSKLKYALPHSKTKNRTTSHRSQEFFILK